MLAMKAAARGQLALLGASAAFLGQIFLLLPGCSTRQSASTSSLNDAAAIDASPVDASLGLVESPIVRWGPPEQMLPPVSNTTKVVEDRHRVPSTVTLDDSFLFEVAVGDSREGFAVITIPASGRCRLVFGTRVHGDTEWRQVNFDISAERLAQLVTLLNDRSIMALAQSYVQSSYEGVQSLSHVRTDGRDKYIYASSVLPAALAQVNRHLRENIIEARPDLFGRSRVFFNVFTYSRHLELSVEQYINVPQNGLPGSDYRPAVIVTARYVEQRESGTVATAQPKGSHLEAEIQDWSDNAVKLVPRAPLDKFGYLYYPERKIKPAHRLMLVLTLLKGRTVLATSVPQPVITLDGAHALEVELVLP
jgi:hypothetical protein